LNDLKDKRIFTVDCFALWTLQMYIKIQFIWLKKIVFRWKKLEYVLHNRWSV
jgi:hypothetical protein